MDMGSRNFHSKILQNYSSLMMMVGKNPRRCPNQCTLDIDSSLELKLKHLVMKLNGEVKEEIFCLVKIKLMSSNRIPAPSLRIIFGSEKNVDMRSEKKPFRSP